MWLARRGLHPVAHFAGYWVFNSEIAMHMLSYLSPTLNFEGGTVRSLPFENNGESSLVSTCVERAISISCEDWDSFETSWDFKRHPLL